MSNLITPRPEPRSARHAAQWALAAAFLALTACTGPEGRPAPPDLSGDPVLLGHAVWCGSNPPSGYCPGSYKR
ncbi:MAG: hypothetical protein ACREIP_15205 [Alphaproteobacteria bacterium]